MPDGDAAQSPRKPDAPLTPRAARWQFGLRALLLGVIVFNLVYWVHGQAARERQRAEQAEERLREVQAAIPIFDITPTPEIRERLRNLWDPDQAAERKKEEERQAALERAKADAADATAKLAALAAEHERLQTEITTLRAKAEQAGAFEAKAAERGQALRDLEAKLRQSREETAQGKAQLAEAMKGPKAPPRRRAEDFAPFKNLDVALDDLQRLLALDVLPQTLRTRYESQLRSWRQQRTGIVRQFDHVQKNGARLRANVRKQIENAKRGTERQEKNIGRRLDSMRTQAHSAAREGLKQAFQAAQEFERGGDWERAAKLYRTLARLKVPGGEQVAIASANAAKRITAWRQKRKTKPPAQQKKTAAAKPVIKDKKAPPRPVKAERPETKPPPKPQPRSDPRDDDLIF